MIGSPDLLAFTAAEGFGEEEEEDEALPEELSVPLLPPSQPWSSSARFPRDFILVAEFSEQVGPKPVLTIPDDPRVVGSFDLNHFSVRLMSVDYQASGPAPGPPAPPGPRLNFSEDSRVILGDSAEDAFAYVHHMTLYDLEARGMVRPFCVAYVCSDHAKLMEGFGELSARFSQASDSLKTGNRQAFAIELRRKLHELEFTKSTLQQEATSQNGVPAAAAAGREDELEAVELLISNHRELLRQVTSYPNRKLKRPDFLPYDTTGSLSEPPPSPSPCPSLSSSASWRSGHRLKPLHELCNSYFLSLMTEQLADAERRLRGDRSVLQSARIARALSRRLGLVDFLFQLCPDDGGEEAEEAEPPGEPPGAEGAPDLRSDPVSLESFLSCVEEIPIKLEAGEAARPAPAAAAAAEMTGSVSSSDSIEVLGTERSYRMQQVAAAAPSREPPPADAPYRRAADGGVRRVRAYARRENSEDSIEVLSTTDSIFPDDLTAITEEEAEPRLQGDGPGDEEEGPGERTPGDGDGPDAREPPGAAAANGDVVRGEEGAARAKDKPTRMSKIWRGVAPEARLQLPEGRQAPDLAEAGRWTPPRIPLGQADEASDRTSYTTSSDPPSPVRYGGGGGSLGSGRRKRRRRAAARALRFLRQNSFSQHAVFCLLSGRPLVVVGGEEGAVRNLVEALSLFLPAPGADGDAVMACLTSPLQVTDLLAWRLIGVHRTSSAASAGVLHSLSRYSRYVAQLDLDQRTLACPSYSGALLSRLADPHAAVRRGLTYLLHLESGLAALANQALLYTFGPAGGGWGPAFLLERGYSADDAGVLTFLSDLLKQRHAGRGPPFLRFSYCSRQLHRNTHAT